MSSGPLSELKVVEVAGSLAVNIAGGLLSDLGAKVLLIEPESGSLNRRLPGFHVWSRGKESLTAADPVAEAMRLAPGADILLIDEDAWNAAGRFETARVTAVIEGLGDDHPGGPISRDVANAAAEAYGGLMATQQGSREGPYYIVETPSSLGAGQLAVLGALVSIYANDESKREVVRVSHLAGTLGLLLFSSTASPKGSPAGFSLDGDPKRVTTPLIRFYQGKDGDWIVIGAPSPSLWGKLCIALDMPELVSDPRFEGAPFLIESAEARVWLVEQIEARIKTRTVAEWVEHLQSSGVICAPVIPPDGILDEEHVNATRMRAEIDHPTEGRIVEPGIPIIFHNDEVPGTRPAPLLDAHSVDAIEALLSNARERTPVSGDGLPLDGLRILDLAGFAAGPGAARLLAGMGADVLKIEGPDGDPFRFIGFSFASNNRGKRSVLLDLTKDEGQKQNMRLLRNVDVLLHNLRPNQQQKFGLTPAEAEVAKPDLVQAIVYGYGSASPYCDYPTIDVVFEALTGGCLVQGGGHSPVGFSGGLADNSTSLMGAMAIMAGLIAKKAGKGGQNAEVSLLRTTMYRHCDLLVRPISRWDPDKLRVDPIGVHGGIRLYRSADGWLFLAASNEEEWQRLRGLAPGLPEAFTPDHEAWNDNTVSELEQLFAKEPLAYWMTTCEEQRIPGVPVLSFRDFALKAVEEGSPLVMYFDDPEYGRLVGLHELIKFSGHEWKRLGRAPTLGEHTESINALV